MLMNSSLPYFPSLSHCFHSSFLPWPFPTPSHPFFLPPPPLSPMKLVQIQSLCFCPLLFFRYRLPITLLLFCLFFSLPELIETSFLCCRIIVKSLPAATVKWDSNLLPIEMHCVECFEYPPSEDAIYKKNKSFVDHQLGSSENDDSTE